MKKNFLTIAPQELFDVCAALGDMVAKSGFNPTGILAVTRGGLVPAGILAYRLGIRQMKSVSVTGYNGTMCLPDIKIDDAPMLADEGKGVLIVDDLADTGRTLEALRKTYSLAKTACPYVKPQGTPQADFYIETVPQDTWIVFPWDKA